jgi:hypothetical protein
MWIKKSIKDEKVEIEYLGREVKGDKKGIPLLREMPLLGSELG